MVVWFVMEGYHLPQGPMFRESMKRLESRVPPNHKKRKIAVGRGRDRQCLPNHPSAHPTQSATSGKSEMIDVGLTEPAGTFILKTATFVSTLIDYDHERSNLASVFLVSFA